MDVDPRITIIAAVASNGAIGRAGGLPWRLPDDLKFFMHATLGKPVIMGRATFETLPGPLPKRRNIVITRQGAYEKEGIELASSLEEAIDLAGNAKQIMIAGGAEIYALALPLAARLVLTEVEAQPEADTYFPQWNSEDYIELARRLVPQEGENRPAHAFVEYIHHSQINRQPIYVSD